MSEERRLDVALVHGGLARSRGQAKDLVDRRLVTLDGVPATKVSQRVRADQLLQVLGDDARWVSRSAHKLVGAFDAFAGSAPAGQAVAGWRVEGLRCLDLGACTGGFTQVLLDRGAAHVVALDVGHDQLAAELRADPRVTDLSGVTVRGLSPGDIGGPVDRVVADLSFISLRLALPSIRRCLVPGGQAVLLVKPQFEVGRTRLSKHGVVGSAAARHDALVGVLTSAGEEGLAVLGLERSPITGGEGNREYLLWLAAASDVGMSWQAQTETARAVTTQEDH